MSEFLVTSWLAMLVDEDVSAAMIDQSDDILTRIGLTLEGHRQQAARINTDNLLSTEGKAQKLAGLNESTSESLEGIAGTYIRELDEQIAKIETMGRQQEPEAANPTLEFLRQAEIREACREMGELELVALYQAAAVEGNADCFMRAVENSPNPFPLITDKVLLSDGMQARAMRGSPELSGKLAELRQVRATISAAMDSALVTANIPTVTRQLEAVAADGGELPSVA